MNRTLGDPPAFVDIDAMDAAEYESYHKVEAENALLSRSVSRSDSGSPETLTRDELPESRDGPRAAVRADPGRLGRNADVRVLPVE